MRIDLTSHATRNNIEVIDLSTDSEDLEDLTHTGDSNKPSPVLERPQPDDPRLSHLKCVICLDTPTDLTATTCGHLYCHECITSALKATTTPSGSASGTCPVCRRKVTIKSLIPLAILKAPKLGSEITIPIHVSTQQVDNTTKTPVSRSGKGRKRPSSVLSK